MAVWMVTDDGPRVVSLTRYTTRRVAHVRDIATICANH